MINDEDILRKVIRWLVGWQKTTDGFGSSIPLSSFPRCTGHVTRSICQSIFGWELDANYGGLLLPLRCPYPCLT